MDRVTKGLVKSYVATAGLQKLSDSQQFERFATHICISKLYSSSFSADDYCVGDGVQGIDALTLAVNGQIVEDLDDLQITLEHPGTLSVEITFIQAKTSSKRLIGNSD